MSCSHLNRNSNGLFCSKSGDPIMVNEFYNIYCNGRPDTCPYQYKSQQKEDSAMKIAFTEKGVSPYLIAGGLIFGIPGFAYSLITGSDTGQSTWAIGLILGLLVYLLLKNLGFTR